MKKILVVLFLTVLVAGYANAIPPIPPSSSSQVITSSGGNLGSGAIINWNTGDVILTHLANTLAWTGATSYTFDAVLMALGFASSGADGTHFVEATNTNNSTFSETPIDGRLPYDATRGVLNICNGVDCTSRVVAEVAERVLSTTCSTGYTPNLANATIFELTLNGACAVANPTNGGAGYSFTINFKQTSTTAPTWGTAYSWAGGTAPTWSTSATKYDTVSCVYHSGKAEYVCGGIVDAQ